MSNVWWGALDARWMAAVLALFPALALASQFPDSWPNARRWLGSVVAYGLAWCLCAVAVALLAAPPSLLVVLRKGDELRLASVRQTNNRNGSSCYVTTYELDGAYVGSTGHRGDCEGRGGGGTLLIESVPWITARDHVLVDLWTAEDITWRSSLVQGPYELRQVDTSGIDVLRADGTTESIPWPSGSNASTAGALSLGRGIDHPTLLDVREVAGTCAGRRLIRHRSVAFGEGTTYLSAVDDPRGEPVWTTDMTAEWGEREVLGVIDHEGTCWAVGPARGVGVRVVAVP